MALLALFAFSQYATWAAAREIRSRLDTVASDQRGLRQQMSNLLSMLLRAGYKRGPTVDWSDDEQRTQVKGVFRDTQWDWRKPR